MEEIGLWGNLFLNLNYRRGSSILSRKFSASPVEFWGKRAIFKFLLPRGMVELAQMMLTLHTRALWAWKKILENLLLTCIGMSASLGF